MGPLISVIIPIYNVEPYIRQCLDSVAEQTYQDLEIILIDDGSPDNCGEICDEYASRDQRVHVIHRINGGLGAARNDGIRAATGKWIAFVDPDDWLELNFFEQMISATLSDDVDVICASCNYVEQRSGTAIARVFNACDIGKVDKITLLNKTLVPGYGLKGRRSRSFLCVAWNKFYRSTLLKNEHIKFDPILRPHEDVLFNLSVFEKTNVVVACECIGYHYRINVEASSSQRFNPNWSSMSEIFIKGLTEFLSRQPDKEAYRAAAAISIFKLMKSNLRCYFFHPSNPKPYSEVAAEFRAMKREPLFHAAIWNRENAYLNKKEIFLKYLLRLPWAWPVKLCYAGKRIVNGMRNG